jgi:outer membrane protein OmpA-like peptidoglycan-associated protein
MRILITGFIVLVIWSFFSMWLYVDILKPATRPHVVVQPVNAGPGREADSLMKLYASMPKDLLIYFDFDKSKLKTDSRTDSSVTAFKDWMDKYPASKLSVIGHADFIGTPEYNLKLGLERAQIVRKYLESKGIASDRMLTESKGKEQLVPFFYTSKGREFGRRTEITIKK